MHPRHRKIVLWLSFLVVFVVGVALTVQIANETARQEKHQQENREFAEDNTFVYGLGDTVILDSCQDEEGFDRGGHVAMLDWEGAMEATWNNVTLFNSPESAGISKDDLLTKSESEGTAFLLCEIMLRNIDAVPRSYRENGKYYISTFEFRIQGSEWTFEGDERQFEIAYFNGSKENENIKDAYCFSLEPGQERKMILGYFVPETDKGKSCRYVVGSSGVQKYILEGVVPEERCGM